jgi:hypothetical protein
VDAGGAAAQDWLRDSVQGMSSVSLARPVHIHGAVSPKGWRRAAFLDDVKARVAQWIGRVKGLRFEHTRPSQSGRDYRGFSDTAE